jgi:hypothetical protein
VCFEDLSCALLLFCSPSDKLILRRLRSNIRKKDSLAKKKITILTDCSYCMAIFHQEIYECFVFIICCSLLLFYTFGWSLFYIKCVPKILQVNLTKFYIKSIFIFVLTVVLRYSWPSSLPLARIIENWLYLIDRCCNFCMHFEYPTSSWRKPRKVPKNCWFEFVNRRTKNKKKKKLRGFGPIANYADRATAASWRSSANFCG